MDQVWWKTHQLWRILGLSSMYRLEAPFKANSIQTTQFFIVFIAVIFSGEAAAAFFSYTTSMTKAATAANFVFWLRQMKPGVEEDPSKPPHDDEKGGNGPAHVAAEELTFSYESRPTAKVLDNINIDVSYLHHTLDLS
jgi:ABC-type multidrug transport system fused ATPase/permease subunit